MVYFNTDLYIYFDLLFVFAGMTIMFSRWEKNWQYWDEFVQQESGSVHKKLSYKIYYHNLKKFVPAFIYPVFAKEFLNYFRNRRYIRLQLITLIVFIGALGYLTLNIYKDYVLYSSVLTFIMIWQHFSLQFNEKYVKADSRFFMKTLPIRYYQLWISKFLTEYIFIVILQLLVLCAYLFRELAFGEIVQMIALINVFSAIVLMMIINFKILFYDQPRFAGYAYHFFIIFTFVMSINYWLVGPLITLVLIIYFTFSSYREFVK